MHANSVQWQIQDFKKEGASCVGYEMCMTTVCVFTLCMGYHSTQTQMHGWPLPDSWAQKFS